MKRHNPSIGAALFKEMLAPAAVNGIVADHGGDIRLDSAARAGTCAPDRRP